MEAQPVRKVFAWGTIGILMLVVVTHTRALPFLFSGNYLPHRYCYLAQPDLIWTNVIMDGLIAASYVVIFTSLFWIVAQSAQHTSDPDIPLGFRCFRSFYRRLRIDSLHGGGDHLVAGVPALGCIQAGLRCGIGRHRLPFHSCGAEDHRQTSGNFWKRFRKANGTRLPM